MKPILFVDFDGTICHDKLWHNLEKEAYEKVQALLFSEDKSIVHKWMRGNCTSEEVNRIVAEEVKFPYELLWEIFVESCRSLKVSKNNLEQIKEVSAKYKTILLTDNMDCFTRFSVPALRLNEYFDLVVNSADTGLFKDDNDGEIFLRLTREHGVKIEECVLVDNSKKSCTRFAGLDGRACFVTPENTIEYWIKRI